MGLVLARTDDSAPKIPGNPYPYDVYIVFRGSRSGDPRALRALREEKGNPDWVTDMDFGAGRGVVGKISAISETGSVSPGFAASVTTMLPTVMACLDDIQTQITYPPRTIYVTGHSLAAALAVHFTSAVLLGRTYGYTVSGSKMPDAIRRWPWSSTQLVPFALPVVGDETFRDAFDIRLASRPVYLSGDPVTQRSRQYAVGWPYRIVPESVSNLKQRGGRISSLRHEPFNIRKYLIKDLQSKKILSDPLPQDFPGEPWVVYKTFKNLLKTSGLMGDVKQILGANFNTRLVEYLEVLFACVGQNEKPRVKIVIDAVKNINVLAVHNIWGPYPLVSHKTISQIYTDSNGIFPSDADFDKFIGLCLFLSAASKLQYSVADAATGIVPFDSLTLK
jgi:hypothetical protein